MGIPSEVIRYGQRQLKADRQYREKLDGQLGPRTELALDKVLKAHQDHLSQAHKKDILAGSRTRKLIAYIQLRASQSNIDTGIIDGYWGPQTQYAFDSLLFLEEHGRLPSSWRDQQTVDRNPNLWPAENANEMTSFYGAAGENLVTIELPYTHRLSWDLRKTVSRLTCNIKVADSLHRVLSNVRQKYGDDGIRALRLDQYGGCFNKRKKRGGSSWSTHAWGIAIDYDPDHNQLRWGRDQAGFARPEYDDWWACWEAEGWVGLGRADNYDWMHIQAAKRT